MGQGRIVSGGPTGLYNIEVLYEISKITARITIITDRLLKLPPIITQAETAVAVAEAALAAAEAAMYTGDPKAAIAAVNKALAAYQDKKKILNNLKLEMTSLEKEKKLLEAIKPSIPRANVWCADLTENLTAGKNVGTIEINGEGGGRMLIMPAGVTGMGKLQPTQASTPAGVFYNWAIMACWQKYKPTYRIGEIKAFNGTDKCSVCIEAAHSSISGLNINQGGVECFSVIIPTVGSSGFSAFVAKYPNHPIVTNTADSSIPLTAQLKADLDAVNKAVNNNNTYKKDIDQYGAAEKWDFLSPGGAGDCEDFALTKLQMLLNKGYPVSALKLTTGLGPNGAGHAWLTVQTAEGDFGLDNNYKNVMPSDQMNYTDRAKQTGSQWGKPGILMTYVPIDYMGALDAGAFDIGDRVVVGFTGQSWGAPKVIGFESHPRGSGTVYRQDDGVIQFCDRTTGAIKVTSPAVLPPTNNYYYMTMKGSELYLVLFNLGEGKCYTEVRDAVSGTFKRRIMTNVVPAGLSLMMFRPGGVYVDNFNNIWISAWFMTQALVNYAGIWAYDQTGVKVASQDQHGYTEILDWQRPGQVEIYTAIAGNVCYVIDKDFARIKQFSPASIATQKVYSFTGAYPIGIVVVETKCYVLMSPATSGLPLFINVYNILANGDLVYVSSFNLFVPPDAVYQGLHYRQQALWISAAIGGGIDRVFKYSLEGVLLKTTDFPARTVSSNGRYIYI